MSWNEYVGGLVNLCGQEGELEAALAARPEHGLYTAESGIDMEQVEAACAVALHMQQPLIPAGGATLETSPLVSNLKYMMDHPELGDNHNAPVFHRCYRRMGEIIPELVDAGYRPRVMLEYSGVLLHGLRTMGLDDVFDSLRRITCEPAYRPAVEWLGCTWGHAVAPSTPVRDFRLQVRAWQHHFAAIFGLEALARVRGFSPAEMALPNHPEVAYEFVRSLRECGYSWVLVQEHTVERPDGGPVGFPHFPQRLVVTDSRGRTAQILALIKTQGSDTKLVGQMQPYFEALNLSRRELAGRRVPPLVSQIADGENGGVMMNEFPPKYRQVVARASGSTHPLVNPGEYLDHLFSLGLTEDDFPPLQPILSHRIWERMRPGDGPERLAAVLQELEADHGFHVEGGSWTNDISWVQGYENLLGPMQKASALFHATTAGVPTDDPRYRNALFHLLSSQTSCFRYWGQGAWTDYGREICRRTRAILEHDF